jgi:DNA primase
MQQRWVDFKAIKQAVPLAAVLSRYGIKLRTNGKELRGRCPIHRGEGDEAFHASPDKNAFHCFSCGAKGNVLDFVAAMESCSVREAALKIADWFSVTPEMRATAEQPEEHTQPSLATNRGGESDEPNKPLGFRLKGIEHDHAYLRERGIDPETAEYFGVGYYSGNGSMRGRVVIPIENERGELVAYAGRCIDGSEPKYKLPAGFRKSQVLYNLSRAREEDSMGPAVLVEGFFDCMKVTQAGHACVALMGCSLSEDQEELLARQFRQVVVMLDPDEAGRRATQEIAGRLARRMWVRVVELPTARQADQCSPEELQELLRTAV